MQAGFYSLQIKGTTTFLSNFSFPRGFSNLLYDERVADNDGDVWKQLKENELAPKHVQAAVDRIVSKIGCRDSPAAA